MIMDFTSQYFKITGNKQYLSKEKACKYHLTYLVLLHFNLQYFRLVTWSLSTMKTGITFFKRSLKILFCGVYKAVIYEHHSLRIKQHGSIYSLSVFQPWAMPRKMYNLEGRIL